MAMAVQSVVQRHPPKMRLPAVDPKPSPLRRLMQQPDFANRLPVNTLMEHLGACAHIPNLGCREENLDVVKELMDDIQKGPGLRLHRSGRHHQVFAEHLTSARIFTALVARLLTTFNMRLIDCWVNAYMGSQEVKSMHHDNYQDRTPKPTMTVGLSLGQERDFLFEDKTTGEEHRMVHRNGDVFAFDASFNKYTTHGVPPAQVFQDKPRVTVIIWGEERRKGHSLAVPVLQRRLNTGEAHHRIEWDGWDLDSGLSYKADTFK